MKKKATNSTLFLCLLLAAFWHFQVTNASGDLGDFGEKVTSLPENEVQKYLTQERIVGRDGEQEQCSQTVFEFRKSREVISFNVLILADVQSSGYYSKKVLPYRLSFDKKFFKFLLCCRTEIFASQNCS